MQDSLERLQLCRVGEYHTTDGFTVERAIGPSHGHTEDLLHLRQHLGAPLKLTHDRIGIDHFAIGGCERARAGALSGGDATGETDDDGGRNRQCVSSGKWEPA